MIRRNLTNRLVTFFIIVVVVVTFNKSNKPQPPHHRVVFGSRDERLTRNRQTALARLYITLIESAHTQAHRIIPLYLKRLTARWNRGRNELILHFLTKLLLIIVHLKKKWNSLPRYWMILEEIKGHSTIAGSELSNESSTRWNKSIPAQCNSNQTASIWNLHRVELPSKKTNNAHREIRRNDLQHFFF